MLPAQMQPREENNTMTTGEVISGSFACIILWVAVWKCLAMHKEESRRQRLIIRSICAVAGTGSLMLAAITKQELISLVFYCVAVISTLLIIGQECFLRKRG